MDEFYSPRHAKKDDEDRFADIENFDVDDTEPEKSETADENAYYEQESKPALDGTENNDNYSDAYGDDFDYQTAVSKRYKPSANAFKSNKDYGDGFDSQTGEDRHEYKGRQTDNDDYYEHNADTDSYYQGRDKKNSKNSHKKNSRATVICVTAAAAVIVVCVIAFVLSKCSFDIKKPLATTAPSTKAVVTTQQPTTEYYEPETEPEYVPDYTEYVEETTAEPVTEEYTEPETEPYTEEYTEPETYEPQPETEPETEYVPEETVQIV